MHFKTTIRADRSTVEVRWFESGRRMRRSFASKSAASDFIADQKALAATGASPAVVLAASRLAAGTGLDLETLVRAGLERFQATGATRADAKMTFRRASELVLARAREHGARERTIESYGIAYSVLNRAFGDRTAVSIGSEEVKSYLATLPGRGGEPGKASPTSRRHSLALIRMALRLAGVSEPLRDLKIPSIREHEVQFFTVDEAKTMLGAARKHERGFLAVALFAGIRPENLELLPAEAVSVLDRRIRIPAAVAKDRKTHLLDKNTLPDVLWAWLSRFPYAPVPWEPLRKRLKRRLGRWVHDGLRHSAATYYCALHGVAKTGHLMTHATENLVRRHYAGVVESESAKKFYELTPEAVAFDADRVPWPSDAELARLLKQIPATKVAARLGCSDSALTKRCRQRGIRKPGRGDWTKREFGA